MKSEMQSDAGADILGVDLGKRLMRNRKPINVNGFAVAHNIIMFCASLYMVIETLRQVQQHFIPITPRTSCCSHYLKSSNAHSSINFSNSRECEEQVRMYLSLGLMHILKVAR